VLIQNDLRCKDSRFTSINAQFRPLLYSRSGAELFAIKLIKKAYWADAKSRLGEPDRDYDTRPPRPGEGRDSSVRRVAAEAWMPACAGMTAIYPNWPAICA
jgi:hypothetical protein